MADQKKFLDSAGVTILWQRIQGKITEKTDPIKAGIEALETYVGTIPSDDKYADITNVIAYVNKKAEETLDAASGNSSETAASVKNQLDLYKTENDAKVQANTNAISDNADDIKSIQEQINLIMSNPDTEGVINSINEFTQYIEEHGEIAEGFRTDINALQDEVAKIDTGNQTVTEYVTAELEAASGFIAENYVDNDDFEPLQNKVDIGDQTVTAYVTAQVNAAKTSANGYTDTAFGKITALSQSEIDTAIAAAAGNA